MELLSLPVEIIGEIIGFVPVSDLSSLHLVSKTVSSLTYKFFNGVVLNPDMSLEERAKYKMIRDIYTPTSCASRDCDRDSQGKFYCSSCEGREGIWDNIYLADFAYKGETIDAFLVSYHCGLILAFTYVNGRVFYLGVYNYFSEFLTPVLEFSHYLMRGHRYRYDKIKVKGRECSYSKVIAEIPLVVQKCNCFITPSEIPDESPTFCSSHKLNPEGHCDYKEFTEEAPLIVMLETECEYTYFIAEGEYKGSHIIVEADGKVLSGSIPRDVCERLGIKYLEVKPLPY